VLKGGVTIGLVESVRRAPYDLQPSSHFLSTDVTSILSAYLSYIFFHDFMMGTTHSIDEPFICTCQHPFTHFFNFPCTNLRAFLHHLVLHLPTLCHLHNTLMVSLLPGSRVMSKKLLFMFSCDCIWYNV
jgi:hypothetical protein